MSSFETPAKVKFQRQETCKKGGKIKHSVPAPVGRQLTGNWQITEKSRVGLVSFKIVGQNSGGGTIETTMGSSTQFALKGNLLGSLSFLPVSAGFGGKVAIAKTREIKTTQDLNAFTFLVEFEYQGTVNIDLEISFETTLAHAAVHVAETKSPPTSLYAVPLPSPSATSSSSHREEDNPSLKVLMETSFIKGLCVAHQTQLREHIENQDKLKARSFLEDVLGSGGIEKLNAELTKYDEDSDFNSVLSQAVKYKKDNSLAAAANKTAEYFKDKMMCFDHNTPGLSQDALEIDVAKVHPMMIEFAFKGGALGRLYKQNSEFQFDQALRCSFSDCLDAIKSSPNNTFIRLQIAKRKREAGESVASFPFSEGIFSLLKLSDPKNESGRTSLISIFGLSGLTNRNDLFSQKFSLLGPSSYELTVFCQKNFSHIAHILVKDPSGVEKTVRSADLKECVFSQFSDTIVLKADKIKLKQLVFDENQVRVERINALERQRRGLVDKLGAPDTQMFLEEALDDLMQHEMKLDHRFTQKQNYPKQAFLFESLASISAGYNSVNVRVETSEILRQALLDANYARLVVKGKNTLVLDVMRLIEEAFTLISPLANKDLILFLGNTGAGKSSSIAYFQGVVCKAEENRYGQTVVMIDEPETGELANYPTIGQSIGVSETIFVRGYDFKATHAEKLKKEKIDTTGVLLCDTPGFNDTRGSNYELAARLTIDQTLSQARQIRAIVLTIAYEGFLVDKANPVVGLLEELVERVPDALQSGTEAHQSVFIIITKHNIHQKAEATFEDRLRAHLSEERKRMETLSSSTQAHPAESSRVESRLQCWQALLDFSEQKRVLFVDITDRLSKKDFVKSCLAAPGFSKSAFAPALNSREIRRLFKEYVEASLHTWRKLIMEPYLDILPQKIVKSQEFIQEKTQRIVEFESKRAGSEFEIKEIQDNQATSKQKIQYFSGCSEIEVLPEEVAKQVEELKETALQQNKNRTESIEVEIKRLEGKLVKISEQKVEVKLKIESLGELIEAKQLDIVNKKEGTTKINLWLYKLNPEDLLTVNTLKPGQHEQAFQEARACTKKDYKSSEVMKAKDARGTYKHLVRIEKEYSLVCEPGNVKGLLFSGSGKEGRYKHESGKYRATVTGKRFEINLGVKSEGNKQVLYSIRTFWHGDIIPEISIDHEIPNKEFFKTNRRNLRAEIEADHATKKDLETEQKALLSDEMSKTTELHSLNEKKTHAETEKKKIIKDLRDKTLQGLIKQHEETSQSSGAKIAKLQAEIQRVTLEQKDLTNELGEDINRLAFFQKQKAYYALIVADQYKLVTLLQQLSNFALARQDLISTNADPLTQEIADFQSYFKQNVTRLQDTCKEDLKFSPRSFQL